MKTYKQEFININNIKPYANNARLHNSEQIGQICKSIKEFGFVNPLLIDSDYNLIAGHGRLEALKQLNRVDFKESPIGEVPAIIISGLSEPQRRALIIADNKIAENAIWDNALLAQELQELEPLIDIDLCGFSNSEIKALIDESLANDDSDSGGGRRFLIRN